MSKKLLSEAQVRRFQSLASIQPIHEMSSYSRDDEETNEELYQEEEDMEMDADAPMEMDAEKSEGEDMGDADVELDEELVQQFMDAVQTIQQVSDALGGAGEDMDMGPEEPMDMDMDMGGDEEDGEELEMDAGEEEEEEEAIMEALKGISYVPSQKEVVKVVAKRVARRLQEAKIAQRRLNRALGKK